MNFWQPNAVRPVTLQPGDLWLFKLHVRNGGWVVGGGHFAHYTAITLRFAWDAFLQRNGAPTFVDMVRRVRRYSQRPIDPETTQVGSSVIVEPFFLPREKWVQSPADWSSNLTRGKSYQSTSGEGALLLERVALARDDGRGQADRSARERPTAPAYGSPSLVYPRLGQGAFRVMVTDAYERRCVATNERTLPVLEAAHIRPYSQLGEHKLSNGLLLRSDLHTLFDRGYMTVTPSMRLRVSRTIQAEFENGRDYYALDGREIRPPRPPNPPPSRELLEWHADTIFRG